jgi:Lon-like protease
MRRSPRRWVALLVVVLLVVAAGVAIVRGAVPCGALRTQPACYVAVRPGPTLPTQPLVEVARAPVRPAVGELLLTTIAVDDTLTLADWFRAISSPVVDTAPRERFFPDGDEVADIRARNAAAMADSQLAATLAALGHLGYDVTGEGARVVAVLEDAVTEDLRADDVVVTVDGLEVYASDEVVDAIGARLPGDRIVLGMRRGEATLEVDLTLGEAPEDPMRPYVGLLLTTEIALPVEVTIEAGEVGGPSAGLVFALEIVERLTDGDLTGGRVVAATGTVDRHGTVGAVGGVRQKAVGVTLRQGGPPADVFLVPRDNLADARGAAVARPLLVVPVDDLAGALDALAALREGRTPRDAVEVDPGR